MISNNIKTKNKYYLMRHGESLANRQGIIVSAPNNALHGYGLTANGAEQTVQAALNTRLDRETIIVSSDYKRAIETADIVKSVIDAKTPILIDINLRERDFGNYELKDHKRYDDIWENDIAHPSNSINGVETVDHTLQRSLKVISALEDMHANSTILLVSHGDILQMLFAHYHHINPRFHRSINSISNAEIRSLAKLEIASKSSA